MAWVPDSTTAGYLGPILGTGPVLQDDQWDDFLHDVLAGVSGLDPTMVRPRWQVVPPNVPDFKTDWLAFGITETTPTGIRSSITTTIPAGATISCKTTRRWCWPVSFTGRIAKPTPASCGVVCSWTRTVRYSAPTRSHSSSAAPLPTRPNW